MSQLPPTACRIPGCPNHSAERGFCVECAKEHPAWPDNNARHKKPANVPETSKEDRKFYDTAQWRFRTQPAMMAYNQICQFLPDGEHRCNQVAKFVHHIRSPKTHPELGHDARNLVCLCKAHHPPTEGDDPENPRPYVPTRWRVGLGPVVQYEHPKPIAEGLVRDAAAYLIRGKI